MTQGDNMFRKTTSINKLIISGITSLLILCGWEANACTSAIIGAELNPYGRPILWKHRDTSNIDNKIEYVEAKGTDFAYVALFNADDRELKEAWMGMNERGFAIMNTASYNIKDDDIPPKLMDKEGILMSNALKVCITVDDFAHLLETLPRPMGVEANFGVIDALGNGAYFETNNHSYKRYDLKDAPDHMMVRTNYSYSGRDTDGFGFVREANAKYLIAPYAKRGEVTPEILTEEVSRSFWHDLIGHDFANNGDRWVVDQDFIPRYKSTATIAIEGCVPITNDDYKSASKNYVMWTGLGYPPCAEIRAVRCTKDGVDSELKGTMSNGHSPLSEKAKEMRAEVFPLTKGNGDKYIDMNKLYNTSGTGYAQIMKQINESYYRKERIKRGDKKY